MAEINGTKQWLQTIGQETLPTLLFLHGGPGTPSMSLFKKFSAPLFKMFHVVLWDQRGTGRSYNKDLDPKSLTLNQILADAIVVTEHIRHLYKKDKIYLMGHSFGATLGLKLIDARPEYYQAYFGISQFINATENEKSSYDWLYKTATERNDFKALRILDKTKAPVDGFYMGGLKDTIKVKQLVTKYKGDMQSGMNTFGILASLLFSKEYGFLRFPNAIKGIQMSLNTIGYSLKGINYKISIPEVKVPVYFFSGKYDQLTPQHILHDYFKTLKAPKKELYIFEQSAHSPLWEEADKFHGIIDNILQQAS
jgi:pimeloyl-ACP methyl ester carboxylesterase